MSQLHWDHSPLEKFPVISSYICKIRLMCTGIRQNIYNPERNQESFEIVNINLFRIFKNLLSIMSIFSSTIECNWFIIFVFIIS